MNNDIRNFYESAKDLKKKCSEDIWTFIMSDEDFNQACKPKENIYIEVECDSNIFYVRIYRASEESKIYRGQSKEIEEIIWYIKLLSKVYNIENIFVDRCAMGSHAFYGLNTAFGDTINVEGQVSVPWNRLIF